MVIPGGGKLYVKRGEKKKIFVPCENTNQEMDACGGGYKGINSV